MDKKKTRGQQASFLIWVLHIGVLFGFAVGQPLYDLLSRNPEFFVARHAKPIDIILMVAILSFLLPVLFVLIEAVAGKLGKPVQRAIHGFFILGLVFILIVQTVQHLIELPGIYVLVSAVPLSLVSTGIYFRFTAVRFFLTVLSPAILIFPLVFLFNGSVYKIVFVGDDPKAVYAPVDATEPVVMVIFDECPITSLLDERDMIDPVRYPNFAALAEDAYWFRNASTVHEATDAAVPAILSGTYPDRYRLPTAAEYPGNIFTLLGGSYDIKNFETVTMLCPEALCGAREHKQNFMQRMKSLVLDLSVVYLHIVFPSDLLGGLPPVTMTWRDFFQDAEMVSVKKKFQKYMWEKKMKQKKRVGLYYEFVDSIKNTERPTLYFIHSELPHVPWEHYPSGRRYAERGFELPGLDMKREHWGNNEMLVLQGYQRHLLQVGFADRLLGDLITALKENGVYDRSLIMVTTDHGVSFWPNMQRRNIENGVPADILPVPLLIKAPYQKKGIISNRNVQTIDILPTVADILDVEMPWEVDGRSALDDTVPELREKVIYNPDYEKFVFDFPLKDTDRALKRKLALFGSGSTRPDGIYTFADHNGLVGRRVSEVGVSGKAVITTELEREILFEAVDPDSLFVPGNITGEVVRGPETSDPYDLAVAVNDRISAVTETYQLKDTGTLFSFIVPETAFKTGMNKVEVFVIERGAGGSMELLSTKGQAPVTYMMTEGNTVTSSEGSQFRIKPDALQGSMDMAELKGNTVFVHGWAADVKSSTLPDKIVIFVNGAFFFSGKPNAKRPDVADHFRNRKLVDSGYYFSFPASRFEDIKNTELRIFAISKRGVASELATPTGNRGIRRP